MLATDLVYGLHDYVSLLSGIERSEAVYRKSNGLPAVKFRKSVSLSYNTIRLNLYIVKEEDGKPENENYIECTLEIGPKQVTTQNGYCENKARIPDLNEYISLNRPDVFPGKNKERSYTDQIYRYLDIADEIAKQAYLCNTGDDYRPGYFSELTIEEDNITLKQINFHNSRSRDHKENYLMRNLELIIPVSAAYVYKSFFDDEKIGTMIVRFSDSSSPNNKICGNKIREKIDEEKKKFEK